MHPDIYKTSLYAIQELMSGFKQIGQRALLGEFAQKYFDNIANIVNTKGASVAGRYF